MLTRTTRLALAAIAALAGGALVAGSGNLLAQQHGGHHGGMHGGGMQGKKGAQASPSTKAFMAANQRMHKDMMIKFSGDADVDFIKGMIPHHQGAIDMAKVVLEHGKDPETRKLAEEIIKAQEAEIAMMNAWLQKKGVK
jgi:uncharacterized protein (DUF305 family)